MTKRRPLHLQGPLPLPTAVRNAADVAERPCTVYRRKVRGWGCADCGLVHREHAHASLRSAGGLLSQHGTTTCARCGKHTSRTDKPLCLPCWMRDRRWAERQEVARRAAL